jgi:DNA-binding winged helix-turn-helix (wHTH) protein
VLSRRFLLQHVWTYEADVESRTVDWHVAALRRRLGAAGDAIETVRGEGYRWTTPTERPYAATGAPPGTRIPRTPRPISRRLR